MRSKRYWAKLVQHQTRLAWAESDSICSLLHIISTWVAQNAGENDMYAYILDATEGEREVAKIATR